MAWERYENGESIGEPGSEGGTILRDEERPAEARITLEESFSITCGVYGWLVHTSFYQTREEADAAFAAMKLALDRIVDAIPAADPPPREDYADRVVELCHELVESFP